VPNDSITHDPPNVESPGRETQAPRTSLLTKTVGMIVNDEPVEIHVRQMSKKTPMDLLTMEEEISPDTPQTYDDEDFGHGYAIRQHIDVDTPTITTMTDDFDEPYYFDLADYDSDQVIHREKGDKERFGHAVFLDLDSSFIRDVHLDTFVYQLTNDDLFGVDFDPNSTEKILEAEANLQTQLHEILENICPELNVTHEDFHDALEDHDVMDSKPDDGIELPEFEDMDITLDYHELEDYHEPEEHTISDEQDEEPPQAQANDGPPMDVYYFGFHPSEMLARYASLYASRRNVL